jgi:hypothetical protein
MNYKKNVKNKNSDRGKALHLVSSEGLCDIKIPDYKSSSRYASIRSTYVSRLPLGKAQGSNDKRCSRTKGVAAMRYYIGIVCQNCRRDRHEQCQSGELSNFVVMECSCNICKEKTSKTGGNPN